MGGGVSIGRANRIAARNSGAAYCPGRAASVHLSWYIRLRRDRPGKITSHIQARRIDACGIFNHFPARQLASSDFSRHCSVCQSASCYFSRPCFVHQAASCNFSRPYFVCKSASCDSARPFCAQPEAYCKLHKRITGLILRQIGTKTHPGGAPKCLFAAQNPVTA